MSEPTLTPGTHVGGFEIEALIGTGGMASVYRARQASLQRRVALKVLAPALAADDQFVERFRREGVHLARLEHGNIVAVYEAGSDHGLVFLAMQLVEGTTLRELIATTAGPLDPARALVILDPIASALDHAHGLGFVHRDVKPANVLLARDGRPYLSDFGLTRSLTQTDVTASGHWLGTPVYMAPEQAAGRSIDARADLYSLACVAFEMLTGEPPFRGDDVVQLLLAHAAHDVPAPSERNPTLTPAVDAVLRRALAKDPEDRYGSARELVAELRRAVGVSTPAAAAGIDRPRAHRRRAVLVVVAAIVVAAAAAGAAVGLRGSPSHAARRPSGRTAPATAGPSAPVRGALLYGAPLDGTGAGFVDAVGRNRDPASARVDFARGAMELAVLQPGGDAGRDLQINGVASYYAELDLAIAPGSRVTFDMGLRWAQPGRLADELQVDTANATTELAVFDHGSTTPITPAVPLPGLAEGKTVHLAVGVDATHLVLYLDGGKVAVSTDTRVPPASTIPGLDAYGQPGTGTVKVEGVRLYGLAGPLA